MTKQEYTKYLIIGILIGFGAMVFVNFCDMIYSRGYLSGRIEKDGRLYAIKKKSVEEGNVIEYPFNKIIEPETTPDRK